MKYRQAVRVLRERDALLAESEGLRVVIDGFGPGMRALENEIASMNATDAEILAEIESLEARRVEMESRLADLRGRKAGVDNRRGSFAAERDQAVEKRALVEQRLARMQDAVGEATAKAEVVESKKLEQAAKDAAAKQALEARLKAAEQRAARPAPTPALLIAGVPSIREVRQMVRFNLARRADPRLKSPPR